MLKKFLTCRISIKTTPRNPSSSTEIQIPFTYYYYIHVNRSHWTFMCTSFQSCIYFLIFLLHVDWMIIPKLIRVKSPQTIISMLLVSLVLFMRIVYFVIFMVDFWFLFVNESYHYFHHSVKDWQNNCYFMFCIIKCLFQVYL